MKRLSSSLLLSFWLMLALSCNKSDISPGIVYMTVAAQTKDCIGEGVHKCLQVKENGSADWTLLYGAIEGFTHEAGYEYKLVIRKEPVDNPPADGSSIRYIVVSILSKTKR